MIDIPINFKNKKYESDQQILCQLKCNEEENMRHIYECLKTRD